MEKIIDLLKQADKLPMHMPGHKRNTDMAPYLARLAADLDITEIDGFDNLHSPEGILKRSMERAAGLKGAKQAFYLVNGSTCGILAAVCAVVSRGEKVICARNCHKSVYNALQLVGADVRFVLPEKEKFGYGEIKPEQISLALRENPDAKLVIITSPTYEGVVSDVEKICCLAHEYDVPVLTDAAHGAHFGFGYGFCRSAAECGADISVESLHKTLPSLTQTAVCYISGNRVDSAKIAEKLAVFETSSPSYLLLASIDGCIEMLAERGRGLFENWQSALDNFYETARKLRNLSVLTGEGFFGFDRSKIVITGANGVCIAKKMRERGIECEMASPYHAVAMTGMGDTYLSLQRLADVLCEIDPEIAVSDIDCICPDIPKRVFLPEEAQKMAADAKEYANSAGCVAAEYIFAYPPGIPLIIPGEEISPKHAAAFVEYEKLGVTLSGSPMKSRGKILVIST